MTHHNYATLEQLLRNPDLFLDDSDNLLNLLATEVLSIKKKMSVLPTARESEALSELIFLRDFARILVDDSSNRIGKTIFNNARIESLILEDLFAGVCTDFLRTKIYTNENIILVVEELMNNLIAFMSKHWFEARKSVGSLINALFDKNMEFYKNNCRESNLGNAFNLGNCAFGIFHPPNNEAMCWIDSLQKGDRVDCIKSSANKMIWSRAVYDSHDSNFIRVRYFGDAGVSYIANKHTDISPFASNSTDYEWREGLTKDDLVDFFNFKSGWVLARVVAVREDENYPGEVTRSIEIKKESEASRADSKHCVPSASFNNFGFSSFDDECTSVTVKVHSPAIAKPNSFSAKSDTQIDDSLDATLISQDTCHSTAAKCLILRPTSFSGAACAFFVRIGNVFAVRGGFDFLSHAINYSKHQSRELFAQAIYLLRNFSENIVQPFIHLNGLTYLTSLVDYMTTDISKNLRIFSQSYLANFIEAVSLVSLRVHSFRDATLNILNMVVCIAVACLKSEILEKQFFGAKLIANHERQFKDPNFVVARSKLVDSVIAENVIDQIVRGHPSLISKTSSVFKLLFSANHLDPTHLSAILTQISQTNTESRYALIALMKDVANDMSGEHINYFLTKVAEDVDEINCDMLDLIITFKKTETACHTDSKIGDLVNDVIWRIFESAKELKKDVIKEIMRILVRVVRDSHFEERVVKVMTNINNNRNRDRNLKLTIKLLREPTVIFDTIANYVSSLEVIDVLIPDLLGKLEAINSTAKLTSSYLTLNSNTSIPVSSSELNSTDFLFREIKRILTFFSFFVSPKAIGDELFRFDHFELLFTFLLDHSHVHLLLNDFLVNYLKQPRSTEFILKTQSFFERYISKIIDEQHEQLLSYFFIIIKNVGLARGQLSQEIVVFASKSKRHKQSLVCEQNADSFFGMNAIWDMFTRTQSSKLSVLFANFITKIYLATEFFETYNQSVYNAQRQKVIDAGLHLFKQESLADVLKGVLLLIHVIRKDEGKTKSSLVSYAQLKESSKIELNVEKNTKYLKERFTLKIKLNRTLAELKQLIALEYNISCDSFVLVKVNGDKISDYDSFRVLEVIGIKRDDLLLVCEDRSLEHQLMTLDKSDFSPQVLAVWREIFDDFSVDGRMFPANFADFTSKATNNAYCSVAEERVTSVFTNYDPNQNGYLDFNAFLAFFRNCARSSKDKQRVVKMNLLSLGYDKTFALKHAHKTDHASSFRLMLSNDCNFRYLLTQRVSNENYKSDLLVQLFELLSPMKENIKSIVVAPLDFISSNANDFEWTYKITLLNALMFQKDLIDNLISSHDHQSLLKAVLKKRLMQIINVSILQMLTRSTALTKSHSLTSNDPHSMQQVSPVNHNAFASLLLTCRLVEKLMKLMLECVAPAWLADLSNFLTFFFRYKNGKTSINKQDNSVGDDETDCLIDLLDRQEIHQLIDADFDFDNANQFFLNVLSSLNDSQSRVSEDQRAILKSVTLSLAISAHLCPSLFLPLLQHSVFKSTMTEGLSHSLTFFKVYYKNLYAILVSTFEDAKVKTEFLKILIPNFSAKKTKEVLQNDNSGESSNTAQPKFSDEFCDLVDLSCAILCEIGQLKRANTEFADFIHQEFNFTDLFIEFMDLFIRHSSTETNFNDGEDQLLISYLSFLEKLIDADEMILDQINNEQKQVLVHHLFSDCLFGISQESIDFESVKCRSSKSRQLAFQLLKRLLADKIRLNIYFTVREFAPFVRRIPSLNGITKSDGPKKHKNDFLGLKNLGCICYMIATLQQFYCIPTFRYGLLMARDDLPIELSEVKDRSIDDNYFHQLQRVMAYLDSSERRDFSLLDFCLSFKDSTGQSLNVMIQQDADEFLKILMDKIENSLRKSPYIGILKSVFIGKICNVITCKRCNYVKSNEEDFYNLSLEVKGMRNATESLDKLTETETISDYMCDSCKTKSDISKRALIKSLPNVLFISLKKMYFDLEQLANIKIHSRYEFPMSLNLKKYMYVDQGEANDFEYNLVGVVIHIGNAEYGHYISLVNANRNDPKRVNDNCDCWYEFDDSKVTAFDMKKFDEDCFGKHDFKEFDGSFASEPNNSKSAYLLVYEKVKKSDLVFEFTEHNIGVKEEIVAKLNDQSQFVFEDNRLHTGFYNLRQFVPEPYQSEIENDNKQLIFEQNILSKTFTRGIVDLFMNINLNDSSNLDDANERRIYAQTILQNLPILLSKVFCVTTENESIDDLVNTIVSALSYLCPVKNDNTDLLFMNFYKDQIYLNYSGIVNEITKSGDHYVQSALCEYLIKVTTTTIHKFKILRINSRNLDDKSNASKVTSMIYQIAFNLGMLLSQFDGQFSLIRKNTRLIYVAFRLANENVAVVDFFVTHNLLNILSQMYMKIDCLKINWSERAIAPMLKLIHTMFVYVVETSKSNPNYLDYCASINKFEFLAKAVKEDFKFEDFETLKLFAFSFCINDKSTSELIVAYLLKLLANLSDIEMTGCLEIFRVILYISDDFTDYRLSLVLGIPQLIESSRESNGNEKRHRYGLSTNNSLKKSVWTYCCPFGLDRGVLDLILSFKEMHENHAITLIYYIVDFMLSIDSVFFYVLNLPSPNYISGTFYDWFYIYCDHHLKCDNSLYSGYKSESFVKKSSEIFAKIQLLSNKINDYIKQLELDIGNKKIFASGSNPYVAYSNYYSSDNEKQTEQEIWSVKQNYIIGKTIKCKTLNSLMLEENKEGQLRLNIQLVRIAMLESRPTGQNNLAISQRFIGADLKISTFNSDDSLMSNFFDFAITNKEKDIELSGVLNDKSPSRMTTSASELESFSDSDSTFLNVDYVLRISVTNTTSSTFFLKLDLVGDSRRYSGLTQLLVPIKPLKHDFLIHTLYLNDIAMDFSGLRIKAAWTKTDTTNVKYLINDSLGPLKEIYAFDN